MSVKTPLNNHDIQFPRESVSLDPLALQDLIQSQGILFEHYRATPSPFSLRSANDEYRPLESKGVSINGLYVESNGFLYRKAGQFTSIFTAITKETKLADIGSLNQSGAQLIIPSTYDLDDCSRTDTQVYLTDYDRLYLADPTILVIMWQLYDYSLTGTDRLNFLVEKVLDIVDSQGNSYQEGADFIIQAGQIKWISSNRPGIDPVTNKGRVVSIRYLYRPYYYIANLLHEVRVAQTINEFTGERKVTRLPQLAILQREYVFLKKEPKDTPVISNSRTLHSAPSGSFGPR